LGGVNEQAESREEFNLNVLKRAVRNCPWSSQLWVNYVLELEKVNKPEATIKAAFNQAMNAGLQTSLDYLQLWHLYLDYLKRLMLTNFDKETNKERREQIMDELRDVFQKAINQLFDCKYYGFVL
jgi:hypothetical protein